MSRLSAVYSWFEYHRHMCSHYVGQTARAKLARMGVALPENWEAPSGGLHIYPIQKSDIIRRPSELVSGDDAVPRMEMVDAHFGLLPIFAKDIQYGKRTYNARSETVAELASFRQAWAMAQHCIIPAAAIYEPDWRSGRFVPTRIERADGETLGIAGLWNAWKSPAGQWVNSFSMLTINADTHPIFKELHRPDLRRPPDQQDKRMVVVLNEDAYDAWLDAPASQSMDFMRQFPAHRLVPKLEPSSQEAQLF